MAMTAYPNGTHCSAHLAWSELRCHDAARTPYPREFEDRAIELAAVFEAIRSLLGDKPIRVGSAYRTPEHNRAVGGAKSSQHVQGRALDLYPPTGMTVRDLYEAALAVAREPGTPLKGLGQYATFTHIDTRPGIRLARWTAQDAYETSGE